MKNQKMLLVSLLACSSAMAGGYQGKPVTGKPVSKINPNTLKTVLTNSADCTDPDVFKAALTKCEAELASAWKTNQIERTDESYKRYQALNQAAKDADLPPYVFSDNTKTNQGQKNSQSSVNYVSVDASGKIVKSSSKTAGQTDNSQTKKQNTGRTYQVSDDDQKRFKLTDEEAEKLRNTQVVGGQLSKQTETEISNLKKYGSKDGPADPNSDVELLQHKAKVIGALNDGKVKLPVVGSIRNELKASNQRLEDARSQQGLLGRVFNPSKELKEERARNKELKAWDKAHGGQMSAMIKAEENAKKAAEKKQKENNAKAAKLEKQLEIGTENTSGQYGGLYGGANTNTTRTINQGTQMIQQTVDSAVTRAMSNKNNEVQMALTNNPANLNQAAAVQAQAEMARNGAKSLGKMALTTQVMGSIQMLRATQHMLSKSEVSAAQAVNEKEAQRLEELASKTSGPQALKYMEEARIRRQFGADNGDAEKQAQNQAATEQGMAAANTIMKAQQLRSDQSQALKNAENMEKFAAASGQGGFTFNPGGPPNPNDPGGNGPGDNNPNNNGQVTNVDTADKGIEADGGLMNPNPNDGGFDAPAPGQFQAGKTDAAGGGPGGGGMGGTGGTSAAKDDSKGGGEAPGQKQAGGAFAGGDGGGVGSKFSRPGGGGGGADNSWMEMMKKFLPGGDEVAKHQDERVDLTDRGLASDQPAVLGRNKNIFEEISKKYQKKNNEGAIVFTGDRT